MTQINQPLDLFFFYFGLPLGLAVIAIQVIEVKVKSEIKLLNYKQIYFVL